MGVLSVLSVPIHHLNLTGWGTFAPLAL
eukprot:COSAG06_NODE_60503_length_270_cov_1.619883_1_plen_27_part_10